MGWKLHSLMVVILGFLLSYSSAQVTQAVPFPEESIVLNDLEKPSLQLHDILTARDFSRTPCETVILEVPVEETVELFEDLVDALVPSPILGSYIKALFEGSLQYGVKIVKMCTSCDSAVEDGGLEDLYDVPEFNRYCGLDVYGHDMDHSGLVMYPMVGSGQDFKVKPGTLPGYIYCRTTKSNILQAPSESWGEIDTVFGFIATITGGAVSFAPDMMGYGSTTKAFKSYLIRDSYLTSTIPLWLKAGKHLTETSNCETALADSAFYLGGSEGGYSAVAIAEGLHKALDVEPISVFSASAPYRMGTATLIQTLVNNDLGALPDQYNYISIVLGAAYSSTNPTNANYREKQDLLKSKHRRKLLNWLADSSLSSLDLNAKLMDLMEEEGAPTVIDTVIRPSILKFIRKSIEDEVPDPCDPNYEGYEVGKHDKFCEALRQNDLLDVLHSAPYPVTICHGPGDKLVSYKNLPNFEENPNLSLIKKNGNHEEITTNCYIEGIFFLASPEFRGYEPDVKHIEGGCISSCSDSPLDFVYKQQRSNCGWVAEDKSRCGLLNGKFAKHCPFTCDMCDEHKCEDSTLPLYLNENKRRKCTWVKRKKQVQRCAIKGVLETCRKTCVDECQND